MNARAAGQDSFTSGPDPAQRSNSVTGVFGQISNAFAAAGPGVLKGSSSASFPTAGLSPPVGTLSIGAAGSGSANFRLDDMVVGGGQGTGPVPVSINLTLRGTFAQHFNMIAPLGTAGAVQTIASIDLNSFYQQAFGLTFLFDGSLGIGNFHEVRADGRTIDTPQDAQEGIFNTPGEAVFESGGVVRLTTPSFSVTPGIPFTFQLGIDAGTSVQYVAATTALQPSFVFGDASADFSHTLSFPTDRPVFNLPPGFTVNSAEGDIVNNRFVVPAQAATPEPASLTLFGFGVVSMAGVRAWRKRRRLPEWRG